MNAKDQAVVVLGLLIILLVAGGVFWAQPSNIESRGEVAGVQTNHSFLTPLNLTIQTEVNRLVDTTQMVAEQNVELNRTLVEKIKTEAKESEK